ncbi:MAG TPA: phytanoyl-CoA dioxygenase family protein [Steroidobacteraceae bacterium]|nr:phytanoyl-CoA dioxygenase family protein [Steroidobacteraceae bacterium]
MRRSRAQLDGSMLEDYARKGWVVAPGFFSPAETEQLVQFTDEVCELPEVAGKQMLYRESSLLDAEARVFQRVENFCSYHLGFDKLIRGGRLESAVEQLLGGPSVLFKEKINFKMSGGAGFEPHQDQQAGWSRYAPLFVTALVSIDPATLENGCLQIADCPRQSKLIGREWEPLTAAEMAGFELTPVPTGPGDVVFFDSFVPHASGANLSSNQRRVLYVTYNRSSDGDHRVAYYADKRASFPPDVERRPGVAYRFRV